MLEELTIKQLTEMAVRENLSVAHRNKTDLVNRLHEHYDGMCTATPDEEFFKYMRKTWKEAQTTEKKSKNNTFSSVWRSDIRRSPQMLN